MKKFEDNPKYKELLQKYKEIKEKMNNLENDKSLFENAIILDSGTTIYPSFSSMVSTCKDEKRKILEALLDICAPIEDTELKNRTDIISEYFSFSKWGLYFFCMHSGNKDFKEHLLVQSISYYRNELDCYNQLISEEKNDKRKSFYSNITPNSYRYKDEYELRKAVSENYLNGEKYISIN